MARAHHITQINQRLKVQPRRIVHGLQLQVSQTTSRPRQVLTPALPLPFPSFSFSAAKLQADATTICRRLLAGARAPDPGQPQRSRIAARSFYSGIHVHTPHHWSTRALDRIRADHHPRRRRQSGATSLTALHCARTFIPVAPLHQRNKKYRSYRRISITATA